MKDNLDLAASAQQLADAAPTGSIDRAAASSVAITLATTRDITDARKTLDGLTPAEVRTAALDLFDRLSAD
ncbi:hypothetical protein FE391_13725 [Nonomuraea sp. KC401]|uniref:Uncharacterized protein n=1 Tax=Nonomuraea longispora TaxID=1848320 RepID=A0A4V2XIR3_9ACTN|nr:MULTISPECIES: hypothetical protein [Nonomuraea]NBE93435.1 hypothetical protein [Nonomuraea sp. K271]TDB99785.1 hypothetical protein E1267_36570 [Nonomuraea longispora]TLF74990.1 hypothetical protein FE391_13725 [Nonomuraea sp. KC401]